MALTREKKEQIVAELTQLLETSKMTVVAKYAGTDVKTMQALKKTAKEEGTRVIVTKNRLFKNALKGNTKYEKADTDSLTGQLLYAFNADDEVAPAQVLASFAKKEPQLEFVGAYSEDGSFVSAEDVKAIASLPSKDQLRGQLVGIFAAPAGGFVRVLSGNIRGVLNALNARAESLGK